MNKEEQHADSHFEDVEHATSHSMEEQHATSHSKKVKRAVKLPTKVLVFVMCLLTALGAVAQIRVQGDTKFDSLRQDELVKLLADYSNRQEVLSEQKASLEEKLSELREKENEEKSAAELLQKEIDDQEILAGIKPAYGQGIQVDIKETAAHISGIDLFSLLEELRNSGAEAIQVNDIRIIATSHFEVQGDSILLDSQGIESPYTVLAIGNSDNLEKGLEIKGGFVDTIRENYLAEISIEQKERVEINSVVD
jgi:uncharacterized protein YlxW (UPF0749 family)